MATHHESTRSTWGKLQNLSGMKLITDVTLLFVSAVDNGYICLLFMSQVWTMKLTESMNICYVCVRVSCTIEVNIKETFMGNDPFLQIFISWMLCSQRRERRIPATMGKPWTYLKQGWFYKAWESSSLDIWILWLLVTLCSMPRGL